jgi:hypothetical protein
MGIEVETAAELGPGSLWLDVDGFADFSAAHGITFSLLSDPDSQVIEAFGILNTLIPPDDHPWHGIPFPGTYVIDDAGVITHKFFENSLAVRVGPEQLLAAVRGEELNFEPMEGTPVQDVTSPPASMALVCPRAPSATWSSTSPSRTVNTSTTSRYPRVWSPPRLSSTTRQCGLPQRQRFEVQIPAGRIRLPDVGPAAANGRSVPMNGTKHLTQMIERRRHA